MEWSSVNSWGMRERPARTVRRKEPSTGQLCASSRPHRRQVSMETICRSACRWLMGREHLRRCRQSKTLIKESWQGQNALLGLQHPNGDRWVTVGPVHGSDRGRAPAAGRKLNSELWASNARLSRTNLQSMKSKGGNAPCA